MAFTKIILFDYLKNNDLVYVKVDELFKQKLKKLILIKYKSLSRYNKLCLGLNKQTFLLEFRKNKYIKFDRVIKIINDLNLNINELYNHVSIFFARGSNTSKEIILNKELVMNNFFVEGYALYLAEGDNGSNGNTKPRKLRFTNSNLKVHKFFIEWIRKHFPNNFFYFNILVPINEEIDINLKDNIMKCFKLKEDQIKIKKCKWKKNTKIIYKIFLNSAIIIDLFLSLKKKVKELCLNDKKLAKAYIRGMMIGEGTVYFNKSRYIRLEMKNKKEVLFVSKLLDLLGIKNRVSLRSNREHMWSTYIGAKEMKKYNKLVGFGSHDSRQKKLNLAVNKKLRVNQYG